MTIVYDDPIFRARPGIILGPYESLLAMLVWLNECLSTLSRDKRAFLRRSGILRRVSAVHASKREQLIAAQILFGQFDALTGMVLLDYCLSSRGVIASRRELFEDVVPFGDGPNSPFAHPLEQGWLSHAYNPLELWNPEHYQSRSLAASVARAVERSGYVVSSETRQSIRNSIEHQATLPPGYFCEHPSPLVNTTITATLGMLERAVQTDLPLLSADYAAPAWKQDDLVETSARILRVVWDEVAWLPRPKTLGEAARMREDDRINGLRRAIDLWRHKISVGDLSDWSDVRAAVRRQVQYFSKKPGASQVARLITYVAVPVGVAETLLGTAVFGLTIGTVGVASQCIADLIERNNSRHWLSMGRDFIVRNGPPSERMQPTRKRFARD